MENLTVNGNDNSPVKSSICGGCLRRIRQKIPVGAKTELIELAKLACPAVSRTDRKRLIVVIINIILK